MHLPQDESTTWQEHVPAHDHRLPILVEEESYSPANPKLKIKESLKVIT